MENGGLARGTSRATGCFCQGRLSSNALSGPVLRDTARLSQRYPPIARYGVCGVSTWPIGCDTPSPFSVRFHLGEHAKWRCDTPPQKGYLSDTCAIPYKNKANGCDTPLRDTISKGYCAIWGGISHWAAKQMLLASPIRRGAGPRGPKDQKKKSRFRARLRISSENEIFERATPSRPYFSWGNRDIEIEIFERD